MSFVHIRPYLFRNLSSDPVLLDSSQVFFIGANGQGKTNLLEAIYYLCYASSFRVFKDTLLPLHGNDEMSVQGKFRDDDSVTHTIVSRYENRKKTVVLDGKTVHDRKELVQQLPCIVFTHDDMSLVKGNPEQRRRFFNQTAGLQDPVSIDEQRIYSKVLKIRNEAVKQKKTAILDAVNIQLATAGSVIQQRRTRVVERFNATFGPVFREVSGLSKVLTIDYKPSWPENADITRIISKIEKNTARDMIMKTSTTGPHRDRFEFRMGNHDFSESASTGQIRLISLALKIAQAEYFISMTGRKPVLLIDDVLLELDLEKRKSIISLLPSCRQAFFTFLPDEPFREYAKSDTLILGVEQGKTVTI